MFCCTQWICDNAVPRPTQLFSLGQSVMAKVVKLTPGQRQDMDVSLKLSDTKDAYALSGKDMLTDFVNFYTETLRKKSVEGEPEILLRYL